MLEHVSVLLNEAIEHLNIYKKGIYVDATTGGGGHSKEILKRLDKDGLLICFDQDAFAIEKAKEVLSQVGDNFIFINSNFENLLCELRKIGIEKIDGIIYDLGVSSFQFDIPERGFSYRFDAKLDMRMNQNDSTLTAWDVVNTYSYQELVTILYKHSDEKYAKSIAKRIVMAREVNPINTTFELADLIKLCLPTKELFKKRHPAMKTFQALRIEVNNELEVFEKSLEAAIDILKDKGRICVITFHSIEDRICKTTFKRHSSVEVLKGLPVVIDEVPKLNLITRKPITPSDEELSINNRAHSAKLRVAEKN